MTGMSWRLASEADGVPALMAQLAVLQNAAHAATQEAALDHLTDALEHLTSDLAATPGRSLACCRGKARVLRERLLDLLDVAVPAEAVTLALAASLLRDLGALESD